MGTEVPGGWGFRPGVPHRLFYTAQVEFSTQLVCAALEEPGADAVSTLFLGPILCAGSLP